MGRVAAYGQRHEGRCSLWEGIDRLPGRTNVELPVVGSNDFPLQCGAIVSTRGKRMTKIIFTMPREGAGQCRTKPQHAER